MARRVYLHIGTMKSGTTYLQSWLDANTERLAEQGMLWSTADNNFRATDDLFGWQQRRDDSDGAWPAMKARIESHPGDVLISNELLAAIFPKNIALLVAELQPAEVHVMITARDLARVVPSQWQTAMRNRGTVAWSQYVDDICANEPRKGEYRRAFWNRQDVPRIVQTWSKALPLDRFTVVTVPPPGTPATALGERFCSVLMIDPTAFADPSITNASLGAHSSELLRRLNSEIAHFDGPQHQWAVKNALARRVLEGRADREPSIGLTQSQHDAVRRAASAMVDRLRGLPIKVVGDLGDLVPRVEAYGSSTDPGHSSDSELLAVALYGLAGMGEILADQRIGADQLARSVSRLVAREERRLGVRSGEPADPGRGGDDVARHKAGLVKRLEAVLGDEAPSRSRKGRRHGPAAVS
ncbi:MAG: hypothetical protein H0V49_12770 [Nocardioidaceae bacterium]|nr:hypothetical protein [Nocardioidaceae bacterium]